ncbi:MAG: hypothetical protein WC783_04570 [Candidatus Paceibacterota bacterium]|jgi:hypothetical protein
MEKDFQTSFIPKKPMIEERATSSRPISFFTVFSIFIFASVLIGTGGLYFYNSLLNKNLKDMESSLNSAKDRFEPSKIVQLQVLDKRLKASTEILSHHIAISPIFQALQGLTMKTIRFTKFGYSMGNEKNAKLVTVKMSGLAVGYRSVALQADLFSKNKLFIDPIFSNLSLDNSGNVIFDLEFSVDPDFIDYEKVIKTNNEQVSLDTQ